MRELGPDRLSKDGRFLILREPGSSDVFRVPVDRRLAALVESSPRARGRNDDQMEITMESTLSPRDIQARIRRGETIDQVADAAGTTTERIEGFAAPVIAERSYMAEQARATTIRRRHATGPGMLLGEAVDVSLAAQGDVADDAHWDAWRREDGRWTVQVLTPAGHAATFSYDAKSRYVLPDDDAARALAGDVADPASSDMAIADALVSEVLAETAEHARAQEVARAETAETALVDESVVEHADDPVAERPHASVRSLKEARDRRAQEQQLSLTDDAESDDENAVGGSETQEMSDAHDLAVPETPPSSGERKKRPERRRVPSWDEIMFGGRQSD